MGDAILRWGGALLVVIVAAALITFMFMSFENMAVNNNQSTRSFDKVENSFVSVNNALIKEINQNLKDDHG